MADGNAMADGSAYILSRIMVSHPTYYPMVSHIILLHCISFDGIRYRCISSLWLRILELGSHSWAPTVWEPTVSGYGFRSWAATHGIPQPAILKSGVLHSGILKSRTKDFGAGQPLMVSYILGSYSLGLWILELGSRSWDPVWILQS